MTRRRGCGHAPRRLTVSLGLYCSGLTLLKLRLLAEEHVRLAITDPKALPNAKKDLADLHCTPTPPTYTSDPYRAAKDADAILLMTDWKEYPALGWARLYRSMRKPALVFDTRNCLDSAALRKLGFKVLNIGK